MLLDPLQELVVVQSSLQQMEKRCTSIKSEKSSLESTAISLRTELDREKKARAEQSAKRKELERELGC